MPKPDPAHKETDKILRDMEKRLDEVYKQAYKEARQTADDFMKQFREMDKKKRQQVKDGELDKAEYERWRRTQVFQGNRYHQMADTLAADMTHTNQIAASVINGYLPEVYAVNHNYGTYEIEKASRINTQYTMYDKQTVERLIRDNPDLLPRKAAVNVPKDQLWNKKHINSAITQGILQGEPIDKIAQRLAATVTDMSHTSAIRNARTMTTSAQNGGRIDSYKRAEGMGIKMLQVWMAALDGRTRHEHRLLDGQKRKVGEAFEVEGEKIFFPGDPAADPALVYNCFVGDTKVASDSKLIRSYKQEYDGKLVEVKTASGVNFTCTPNHPILTPFGWIGADRLNKGDNILVTVLRDRSALSRYSNIDHVHPCMETLHDTFKRSGAVSRNSPLTVNFHGDIPTSDIEIVTKKRLLRFNRNACFYKLVDKFLLKYADESLVRKCTFMKHFGSVMRTSFSNISRKCKSFPFFWRSLSHSNIHGFRTISRGDAVLTEYPIDNLAAESVIDGELLDRLSGKVFLDKIIDINVCVLKTHVYNLQTKNGYYFANSIIPQNGQKCNGIFAIAKNCRCTLIGEVEGVDYNLSDVSQRDNKLGDMTYEEWKEEKQKQDNAELPAPKPEPKPKTEDKPVEVEVPAPTVEKPDAVDETIPQREEFKPASTIEEAEQFIMQYMDFDQFGALREVNYKGIALDAANEINATISRLYNEFNIDKFGGIVAPAKNTKLGKAIDKAVAGYMPMRNSFVLNKSALKSVKIAEKGFAEENKLMKDMLEHPEKYDFSKISRAARTVIENSKISGRGTVPDNITEALTHEFGHALEKQVKKHELWDKVEKDMQTYAPKISGYATTQKGEYIAESFASWQKGEKFADPNLIKIFESLRRK
jgi:hypothetical protein